MVKTVEERRKLREIESHAIGFERATDIDHHLRVPQQMQRKCAFGGFCEWQYCVCNRSIALAGFRNKRRDASMRILQVRTCIAFERDHAIEVKDIIFREIAREIRVFHSGDSDRTADRCELISRKSMRRCVGIL